MSLSKQETKVMEKLLNDLIHEEKRGHAFFRDAAKVSDDPQVKKLFEWLAQEEVNHLEILRSLKQDIGLEHTGVTKQAVTTMEGKLVNILDLSDLVLDEKELPHLELFKAQEFAALLEKITPRSVIRYAMQIEFDNARHIRDFFAHVQSRKYRDLLGKLIEDEKQHFLVLKNTLNRFS